MNRTRVVALACLLAVAVVALAVLLVTRNSGTDWNNVAVAKVGFSNNRSTVWAQTLDYHSDSCFDIRIRVDRDREPWKIGVQVHRTSDVCTAEAAIGGPPSPASGVVVAHHADAKHGLGNNLVTSDLASPAPAGVTLAIDQP